MSPKFVIFNNFGDTLYTVFIYFRPYFLLFPVHPNHQLIDAPNHRYYENGHACQQPEEDKIVIQVVFPGVIAEDSENYQRHLVQQMVLDGDHSMRETSRERWLSAFFSIYAQALSPPLIIALSTSDKCHFSRSFFVISST